MHFQTIQNFCICPPGPDYRLNHFFTCIYRYICLYSIIKAYSVPFCTNLFLTRRNNPAWQGFLLYKKIQRTFLIKIQVSKVLTDCSAAKHIFVHFLMLAEILLPYQQISLLQMLPLSPVFLNNPPSQPEYMSGTKLHLYTRYF